MNITFFGNGSECGSQQYNCTVGMPWYIMLAEVVIVGIVLWILMRRNLEKEKKE
jgi:hypothetical protein